MKLLKIEKVICTNKSILINWLLDDIPYQSVLYLHTDHSWHFDPETRELPESVLNALELALLKHIALCQRAKAAVPAKTKPERPRKNSGTWYAEDVADRFR